MRNIYCKNLTTFIVIGVLSSSILTYAQKIPNHDKQDNAVVNEIEYPVNLYKTGLLTGGTVSAAIAKLPSVAYNRSFFRHSPTFLMIRGMNSSANRVTVNDTALLGDPKHDRSDYTDMFFTKMFDKVTLKNTFSSDETADAAGGIIKLTIDPSMSKKGLLIDAEILEHNEKSSPLILLSYASHFGDKYQHVLRYGVKKAEGPSYSNKFGSWVDNTPFPYPTSWEMQKQSYQDELTNIAYSGTWNPDEKTTLTGSVVYAHEDESNNENSVELSNYTSSNVVQANSYSMDVNTQLKNLSLGYQNATNKHDHTISTLNIHREIKGWDTEIAWAFDKATRDLILDYTGFENPNQQGYSPIISIDWTNRERPTIEWGNNVFAALNNDQSYLLDWKNSTSYPRYDKQTIWKFNAEKNMELYGYPSIFSMGTSYTDKIKKLNKIRDYYSNNGKKLANYLPQEVEWPISYNHTSFPLMPNPDLVTQDFNEKMDSDIYKTRTENDNVFKEKTGTLFVQEQLSFTRLDTRFGLRYEYTDYKTTGIKGDDGDIYSWGACDSDDSDPCEYKSFSKHESILSPSVLTDYKLSSQSNLISSISKTYYKPPHNKVLVKAGDQNSNRYWYTNPELESPTSLNLDIMYQHSSDEHTYKNISVFAKQIKGLIVGEYKQVYSDSKVWEPSPSYVNNEKDLTVQGVILDTKQPIVPILKAVHIKPSTLPTWVDGIYLKSNLTKLNKPTITYKYPNLGQEVHGIPPSEFVSSSNNLTLGYENDRFFFEATCHSQKWYLPYDSYLDVSPTSNNTSPGYNVIDSFNHWSFIAKAEINNRLTGVLEYNQLNPEYEYQGQKDKMIMYSQFTESNDRSQNQFALGLIWAL